ncbi:MAG: lyase family protein, partial [Brevundimonas sp.]
VAGNPAIPLVAALIRQVEARDAGAASWAHHGATSQDIIDTGLVLQARAGLALIGADLDRVEAALAGHASAHADTIMTGRTLLQHALPTTFGLKAAGWLDGLRRARRALTAAADDLAPQLGGAAGTLASMGADGPSVLDAFARELGFAPAPPWHARRERVALLGSALAVVIGSLGKAALDLALMMQTEVGEAFEPAVEGGGGSSAMPHKRNPVAVVAVQAAARRAPGVAAALLAALSQAYERDIGGWHAEWEVLPELFGLAGGAAARMADVFEGLELDVGRMRRNLDLTRGLPFAEAAALALTPSLGRTRAHALVKAVSERALREGVGLRSVLEQDAVAAKVLKDRLDELFDPSRTLAAVPELIRRLTKKTP